MPVIKRITLDILSKNNLKEIESDVVKFETLVERKRVAMAKLNSIKTSRGRTKSSYGIFRGQDEDALPSSMIRRRNKTATDRKADADEANALKSKDRSSKSPIKRNEAFRDLATRTERLEKGFDETTGKIKKIASIVDDPINFMVNMITGTAAARIFTAIAVVTLITKLIESKVSQLFGPGGAMDIRVLLRNETKSFNQLDLLLGISNGTVYYSSDLRILSHVVSVSSTQNSGERDRIFKERNVGSDLIG